MTYQEKVKFLKRYKQIDKEIDQLLREKSEIFSLGTKITPTYSEERSISKSMIGARQS